MGIRGVEHCLKRLVILYVWMHPHMLAMRKEKKRKRTPVSMYWREYEHVDHVLITMSCDAIYGYFLIYDAPRPWDYLYEDIECGILLNVF